MIHCPCVKFPKARPALQNEAVTSLMESLHSLGTSSHLLHLNIAVRVTSEAMECARMLVGLDQCHFRHYGRCPSVLQGQIGIWRAEMPLA